MEPENQPPSTAAPAANPTESVLTPGPVAPAPTELAPAEPPYRGLRWIFIGDEGLRSGWCIAIFLTLFRLLITAIVIAATHFHWIGQDESSMTFTPAFEIEQEFVVFLCLLCVTAIMAKIEGHKIADYYLRGPRRVGHFLTGAVVGFLAFSALVGMLVAGGWVHLGPITVPAAEAVEYAALWGLGFLLVGFYEEGEWRCYLQFTLTRGINFWWALACVAAMCLWLAITVQGNGNWGVYAMALLGFFPCLVLHLKSAPRSGAFWQAAWVTSTYFGFVHTGNGGENWIGILQAAVIGFVFCMSVRFTGSAWWAIGCHAAWDWAETYFYGAVDSGMVGQGHLLSAAPAGNPLLSGGTDGPEGSLLGLPLMVLLGVVVLLLYARRKPSAPPALSTN
jgi:membrane protease YdiL (CAAX protease family)